MNMRKIISGTAAALLFCGFSLPGAPAKWPPELTEIQVVSSYDRTLQPSMFYAPPKQGRPVPLLVGLHTWSSNHKAAVMPYYEFCRKNSWAFLYPNFRGANRNPGACGSEGAVQDILDAVAAVRGKIAVDPDRIYLAGNSGGGHMALLMAGRHPEIWAGVSACVPISDLAAWHGESLRRKKSYWKMLERVTGGAPGLSKEVDLQYRFRSPITYLAAVRGKVKIDILAGINDGHGRGSVPIRHSLRAFNLLAAEADRIPDPAIETMTRERKVPSEIAGEWPDVEFRRRRIHFRRISGNVRVTIFEGGHETMPVPMLNWLSRQRRGAEADFSVPEKLMKSSSEDSHVSG